MEEAEFVLAPRSGGLLSNLFEAAAIGMMVADRTGRLVAANPALHGFLGYAVPELIGRTMRELGHPDDPACVVDSLDQLAREQGARLVLEKRCLRQDGRTVWGRLTLTAIGPEVPYVVGMVEDLSEHKRAERRHAIRLAVTRQLAEAPSAHVALDAIFGAMCRSLEWDYGELWMLDGTGDRLEYQLNWHRGSPELQAFAEDSRRLTFARGMGLPGRVWAERRPIWLHDARHDPYFVRHDPGHVHGLQGAIAFPIVSGSEFLGVMAFFSRHLEEPDEDLLAMMVDVGAQIDQFLMRRKAEDELLQLGSVLAATDDGVLTLTPDGRIMSWNHALEALYGYSAAELAGSSVDLLHPADRKEEGRLLFEKMRKGERVEHFETVRQRKDGTLLDVSVTIAPIVDMNGRLSAIISVIRDITAQKRAERYKDEFLSVLSHELKTPLNFIMGFASILSDDETLSDTQRNCVAHIIEGADRLHLMIRNLLCLTDILAERFEVSPEYVPIEGLVQEAVLSLLAQAEKQGLTVETLVPPSVEAHVDGHKVLHLVTILLENAIKFTPAGGAIRVEAGLRDHELRLDVTDTGIGIEPADQPRLFARLQQLDMSSTRKAGGLGIGLSIAKAIAAAHGGSVGVESRPGEGSRFRVRIPQP